ncbi:MAG: MAPEG family protein [Sphingomonas sp.]
MTTELTMLAWGCLLAIVHIFAAVRAKTAQYGTKWNVGARDETLPPLNPIAGRLARAQANFFETFPVMIAAVAIVSIADLESRWTAIGAGLWLAARLIYLPLYGFGVPMVRTLVWAASIAGIGMVLWPALAAAF